MAGRSQFPVVKEEAGGFSVSQFGKSLSSVVQNAMKEVTSEIEGKNIENAFLKEKLKIGELEKSMLEKECYRLKGERAEFYLKWKESEVDQIKFIEMRKKNCDLECEKMRAETDLEVYRRRFKELEGRVLCLEKDLEMLSGLEKNDEEGVDMDVEKDVTTVAPGRQNCAKSEVLSDVGSSDRKRTEDKVIIIDSDDESCVR